MGARRGDDRAKQLGCEIGRQASGDLPSIPESALNVRSQG